MVMNLFLLKINKEIKEKFGFTVNIGIANNKLCAKMASDFENQIKFIPYMIMKLILK